MSTGIAVNSLHSRARRFTVCSMVMCQGKVQVFDAHRAALEHVQAGSIEQGDDFCKLYVAVAVMKVCKTNPFADPVLRNQRAASGIGGTAGSFVRSSRRVPPPEPRAELRAWPRVPLALVAFGCHWGFLTAVGSEVSL